VAPTATISLIAGTSQSIEPPFSNVYARNNISGKFLEVNENLVTRLKELDLWEDVCEEILLRQGELAAIPGIPQDVRRLFKTAYEISPLALVHQASVVQKWVDQGASRNIYLTTKNPDALSKVYLEAWKTGLKSTYYAFSQPGSRAEATFAYDESRPKAHLERGGGAGAANSPATGGGGGTAVLVEPMTTLEAQACAIDDPDCEACQ
jgi:ribonucleoside-diphosphate reductase alpha chain